MWIGLLLCVVLMPVCNKPGELDAGESRHSRVTQALGECELIPICSENARLDGVTPRQSWDIWTGFVDYRIQGFASPLSINKGQTVTFKIRSADPFKVTIFRVGWYGGNGARAVETLNFGLAFPASTQPPCAPLAGASGDCGNWDPVATYAHDSSVPSGLYFARVTTVLNGYDHGRLIPFVVGDDSRTSDVLAQLPDVTWLAYNNFTENATRGSFYAESTVGTYRRPYLGGTDHSDGDVITHYNITGFNPEHRPDAFIYDTIFTTIRFLERHGVNVAYTTGQEVARDYVNTISIPENSILLPVTTGTPRAFLTMGHDEYWSQEQRDPSATPG